MSTEDNTAVYDQLRETVDIMHEWKDPASRFNLIQFPVLEEAGVVEQRLAATRAGSMLLKPGESFGVEGADDYYGPMELKAGDVKPSSARITAVKGDYGDGSSLRSLEATLFYRSEKELASQELIIESTSSRQPRIYRKLFALSYAETGYEGHGFKELEDQTPEDVEELLGVMVPFVMDVVVRLQARKAEIEAAAGTGQTEAKD